ncbi:Stp1/IreP family PP2C-type Ser/Thr phosphatase [Thermotalea metallivorans]|uniref:Serine/threonine phosphatase stp n=1 Tax=Thermotalea metallivorans TaxID=520762 RepID=A0A140L613_9FIRM|nr:Stp1/IreP family PP2C-type Ser/Thr phosphatase [Thermotalea metallivorans]KXG75988.1 Serine/threonine phosphatase stp [Thermotalea metallivorans]
MEIGAVSHIGLIREVNEDAYFISDDGLNLFIVADGMGGHKAGEVASNIAIESVKNFVKNHIQHCSNGDEAMICKMIREAVLEANRNIYEKALAEENYQGMGTTLTMALILSKLFIGHIGDSRAYLLRNNEILQITQDHSLVGELLRKGSITEKEAKIHPQRNIITRALGTEENILIDLYTMDLEKGDIVVLCSDGLSNLVDHSEIQECLRNCGSMQLGCEHLVTLANERGGYDNITMIAIKND